MYLFFTEEVASEYRLLSSLAAGCTSTINSNNNNNNNNNSNNNNNNNNSNKSEFSKSLLTFSLLKGFEIFFIAVRVQ